MPMLVSGSGALQLEKSRGRRATIAVFSALGAYETERSLHFMQMDPAPLMGQCVVGKLCADLTADGAALIRAGGALPSPAKFLFSVFGKLYVVWPSQAAR